MITWQEWGYIIGGYLSGSVLYSYLLPKALKGIDITAESPDGQSLKIEVKLPTC